MENIFNQHTYFRHFYYKENKRMIISVGLGALFWLFLGITMPFGIYNHTFPSYLDLLIHLLPLGLLWPIWIYIIDFTAFRIFPDGIKENNKDLFLWGIKLTFIVHSILFYRGNACEWACINLREYLELWLACLIVFLVVYIVFLLWGKNRFIRKELINNVSNPFIVIKGTGKEMLRILPDQLLFIQSNDNYVEIYFSLSDNKMEKRTLRATLKSVLNQIDANGKFIQCHRSYIVNTDKIISIENGKNILVSIPNQLIRIPLSKTYRNGINPNLFKK